MKIKSTKALCGTIAVLISQQAFLSAAEPSTQGEVLTLDAFEVSEVPLEDNIMPTARSIGSVMGDARNIVDTPRSVTSVNKAWMRERGVKNAMDYGQFAPGVYSAAQYGVPATPQIRGDLAETYVNGQRTKFSRNTMLPSFNGVEALDIVKGPGSAVYGPQGMGPGGYVNMVTKQPYFDKQRTELTATLGYLSPGRNYSNPEFTADTSGPLSDKLAYRVSYLSRYGDGYYLNTHNESQDLFAALTYKPTETVTFDWFGQYVYNDLSSVSGMNRVTQDLIDNGTYIAGPSQATNLFGQPSGPNPFFQLLDPATATRVKLDPFRALVNPNSYAKSKRFQTQLSTTVFLENDAKLVNRSYFENRSSKEQDFTGYSAYVPHDFSVNNRTEYHNSFRLFGFDQKFITGLDLRYEELTSYQDFSVQPISPYDLTQPGSTYFYQPFSTTGTFGGFAIPGAPGFSATNFPIAGVQDSKFLNVAAFFQQDLQFTKNLSSVIGFRVDRIDAEAANPELVGIPYGGFYDAKQTVVNPSYFGSLIYKPTASSSLYFTYNRVNASSGSNFGGVDGTGGDEGLEKSLTALSELYEVGFKKTFFEGKLYTSASVFSQTRMRPQLIGPALEIDTKGLELEAVYQPTKALTFNANASFQDAEAFGTFFYQQTNSYLDFYPVGFPVDGSVGTGAGSPNYGGLVPANGKSIQAPGVPRLLANAFVTYQFDSGFGFGAGPQLQGKQNANAEGTLVIPLQVQWNGFIFYRQKTWDVQLNLSNLTNERFYDPVDVTFAGNDLIFARPLITASLTVRYRF